MGKKTATTPDQLSEGKARGFTALASSEVESIPSNPRGEQADRQPRVAVEALCEFNTHRRWSAT